MYASAQHMIVSSTVDRRLSGNIEMHLARDEQHSR
jgi:hypothetical protein